VLLATTADGGLKLSEWTPRANGFASARPSPRRSNGFKLLWGNKPTLWVAGPTGAGSLYLRRTGSGARRWKCASPLICPARCRATSPSSQSHRFIFAKGGKVYDQHFTFDGAPAANPKKSAPPATLQDSRVNTWIQVAVTVALVFVVFGTVRRRRATDAGEAPASTSVK